MANYDLTYEGSRVQSILDTGDELRDAGYIFRGEATPSTVPGTPTERVAYIGGPGTYTNFGSSTVVPSGSIGVFKYTGSAWSNEVIACTVPISTTVQNNDTTVPTGKAVKTAVDAVSGAVGAEATARADADTALGTRIDNEATARGNADTALQNAINTINTKLAEGYVYVGIATATTNPGTPTGKVFYIATAAGTYTNFGNAVVTAGLNVLKYNGSAWSVDQVIAIDAEPTQGSDNLVKSGGVLNSIIQNGPAFDLSAYNAQGGTLATYADLSAALTALNALPADFKKGGMSIKFVQSSDNNYIQARLMANAFTTNITKWQVVDAEPVAKSKNLIESGGVRKFAGVSRDALLGNSEIVVSANSPFGNVYYPVSLENGQTYTVYNFSKGKYLSVAGLASDETTETIPVIRPTLNNPIEITGTNTTKFLKAYTNDANGVLFAVIKGSRAEILNNSDLYHKCLEIANEIANVISNNSVKNFIADNLSSVISNMDLSVLTLVKSKTLVDGAIANASNARAVVTDFIPCLKTVFVNLIDSTKYNYGICFYSSDSEEGFISGVNYGSASSVNVPSGASYFRINF